MRQLLGVFLSLGALAAFGQTLADSPETIAKQKNPASPARDSKKSRNLVQIGALPKLRLEQALQDLADAQDDGILARTLIRRLAGGET